MTSSHLLGTYPSQFSAVEKTQSQVVLLSRPLNLMPITFE
jgi:hypothetical protein